LTLVRQIVFPKDHKLTIEAEPVKRIAASHVLPSDDADAKKPNDITEN
jgi:hypothetical protein